MACWTGWLLAKKPFENIFFERIALEPLITDLPILIFFSTQVSLLSDNDVPTEDVTGLVLSLTYVFVTYGCIARWLLPH